LFRLSLGWAEATIEYRKLNNRRTIHLFIEKLQQYRKYSLTIEQNIDLSGGKIYSQKVS